ncbi:MAG: hypothetical protein RLZZ416_567, partial [Candidatus Parcubacteria bacterium]
TPAFTAIALAWQEATLRPLYALTGRIWSVERAARGLVGMFSAHSESKSARAIPVLTYHRIVSASDDLNNVTARHFLDQMLALKNAGWQTITLKQYEAFLRKERALPEKSFLLTFDDGAKESFYPVDPILAALGYNAVIYVIASAAHMPESAYYLSDVEIRRMLATSRWEIGSHSYDGHRPYRASGGKEAIFFADKLLLADKGRLENDSEFEARVRQDLVRAHQDLESSYHVAVDSFAFPLGNETGVAGAANYPAGATITERIANSIYMLGFLQTSIDNFSYNYPGSGFLSYRIHVDYDWDGKKLLEKLDSGFPKSIPYEDDFSADNGWIASWGSLSLGARNFSLSAKPISSSASAFLDGSADWDTYQVDVAANWTSGYALLLVDVVDAKTYDTCAFGDGAIKIQHTTEGNTTTVAEKRLSEVHSGADARIGARVHDSVIECTWNYASIVESYDRSHLGGIGMQVWDSQLGSASMRASEILVRPLAQDVPVHE